MLYLFSTIVFTYLLASIPFGLVVAKVKKVDLRASGSGNIGATNVYRAMGFKPALLVFALDAIKGFIPVYMATQFFFDPSIHILIGIVAIAGHSLSIFVKFKGGKGAATGIGVLAALNPLAFCILFPLAVVIILTTRYVSVATLTCSALAPLLLWLFNAPWEYSAFSAVAGLLIWIRHKANIQRLIKGVENKV